LSRDRLAGAALLLLALGAEGHDRTAAPAPVPRRAFPIAFARDDERRFTARSPSGTLFLRPDGAALVLPADPPGASRDVLTTALHGADPTARAAGLDRPPGRANPSVGLARSM